MQRDVSTSGGTHLSVRVPWHDSGWNGSMCSDPASNASCILLKNVAERRDDTYEIKHWQYEAPLEINHKKLRPDFTITTSERTVY
jgi:hypothetical protein